MAKQTLLHDAHVASGARMAEFAGWDMPVRYVDILPEHQAVRGRAGLFDVSHMGELRLVGPGALACADRLVTNRIALPERRRASYSPMCREDGGTIDDLFVHALSRDEVLLVVNAGNIAADAAHIRECIPVGISLIDESEEWLQVAIQGPMAARIAAGLPGMSGCGSLPFMGWMPVDWGGYSGFAARSGYTGEDGFECYVRCGADKEWAVAFWNRILLLGEPFGLVPAGLGARDSLRMEASLPLYGHELSLDVTPVEAGLGRFVHPEKGDFLGRDVLARQLREGTPRALVGLVPQERGIPREGCLVVPVDASAEAGAGFPARQADPGVGHVTTGGVGLTIGHSIAMALVGSRHATPGTRLGICVRDRVLPAEVVTLPFRKRPGPV